MVREVVEPTVEHDGEATSGHREIVTTHPAFAQIGASRVHGTTNLYGSDFDHHYYIRIRIAPSKLHRHLANDWPREIHQPYIEVDLSEAQWAEFVSSMNMGSGVQCTLRTKDNKMVPGLPRPPSRQEQFSGEVDERMQAAMAALDELSASIDALKISAKQREDLKRQISKSRSNIKSNVSYVAKQFDEHMETTTRKARTEINAFGQHYMTALAKQLGAKDGTLQPVEFAPQLPSKEV